MLSITDINFLKDVNDFDKIIDQHNEMFYCIDKVYTNEKEKIILRLGFDFKRENWMDLYQLTEFINELFEIRFKPDVYEYLIESSIFQTDSMDDEEFENIIQELFEVNFGLTDMNYIYEIHVYKESYKIIEEVIDFISYVFNKCNKIVC